MYALTVSRGAGTIQQGPISPEEENAYYQSLQEALQAWDQILSAGESSLGAVEATVRNLEYNTLFNAGRGAVFTSESTHKLEYRRWRILYPLGSSPHRIQSDYIQKGCRYQQPAIT